MKPEDIAAVAEYEHDPEGFACDAYRWCQGELKDYTGPRDWQRDVLRTIGGHLQDKATRHKPLRIAVTRIPKNRQSVYTPFLPPWFYRQLVPPAG